MVDPVSDAESRALMSRLTVSHDFDLEAETERMRGLAKPIDESAGISLSFRDYLRDCGSVGQFNTGLAFLVFCECAGLEERRAYLSLHDSMKAVVRSGYRKMTNT